MVSDKRGINAKTAIKELKAIGKFAPKNMRLAADWSKPWQVLISTILSAQNRDEKTIEICDILFKKYNTIEKLASASLRDIERVIHSINYYKTKARHIKETAKIISNKYNGEIPRTIGGLLELPGVGRKTANVYLAVVHKEQVIGVDTHVARLSQKLGWTTNKVRERIEKDLERLFPKEYRRNINYTLVRFGRKFGKSRKSEDALIKEIKEAI